MAGIRGSLVIFWFAHFYFGAPLFGKGNIGLDTGLESVPDSII